MLMEDDMGGQGPGFALMLRLDLGSAGGTRGWYRQHDGFQWEIGGFPGISRTFSRICGQVKTHLTRVHLKLSDYFVFPKSFPQTRKSDYIDSSITDHKIQFVKLNSDTLMIFNEKISVSPD
jgi:hypothetical protein